MTTAMAIRAARPVPPAVAGENPLRHAKNAASRTPTTTGTSTPVSPDRVPKE
ncbi:hypothetical protein [Streptomyces sp. NPDC053431]|uniref:hypothetical protein n=1 Tax=Streptomyces sp. NPDC053431 TaxID=3365703 RepID=UPI0037CDB012